MSIDFTTLVFAAPGREPQHRRLLESIQASDLGPFEMLVHPPELTAWEHWEATHRKAAAVKTPFVLVLEDDVILNRHVRHNIETWSWPTHREFGAGWLFSPGGWGRGKDLWYSYPSWYCTQGVLYPTGLLPGYIDATLGLKREAEARGASVRGIWDGLMSQTIRRSGRMIRVHGPPLVEHLDHLPSALANAPNHLMRTTCGQFREDWRRPVGR